MFLFCLVFAMFCARLFICALWSPAGKGLTSWLSFVVSSVSLSLSHWYPGSGVVLDCIDSWSLHHYLLLQSHIEPALDWSCSAAQNFDVNAVTTEHNNFSCHLHGSDGTSIQPGTKVRACWFCHWYIYTMYKQQSIKPYKRSRRG